MRLLKGFCSDSICRSTSVGIEKPQNSAPTEGEWERLLGDVMLAGALHKEISGEELTLSQKRMLAEYRGCKL